MKAISRHLLLSRAVLFMAAALCLGLLYSLNGIAEDKLNPFDPAFADNQKIAPLQMTQNNCGSCGGSKAPKPPSTAPKPPSSAPKKPPVINSGTKPPKEGGQKSGNTCGSMKKDDGTQAPPKPRKVEGLGYDIVEEEDTTTTHAPPPGLGSQIGQLSSTINKNDCDELKRRLEELRKKRWKLAEDLRSKQTDPNYRDTKTITRMKNERWAYDKQIKQVSSQLINIKDCKHSEGLTHTSGGNGDDPRDVQPIDNVCGPDITDKMIAVMESIMNFYESWSAAERSKKCTRIVDPTGDYNNMWDIDHLSPVSSDIKILRVYAPQCAKPDPPCGLSVELFGYCVHPQIANYMQWGLMNKLCDQETTSGTMQWLRGTLTAIKNLGKTGHYDQQIMMIDIGSKFVDIAGNRPERDIGVEKDGAGNKMYRKLTDKEMKQVKKIKQARKAKLKEAFDDLTYSQGSWDDWNNRSEKKCQLTCKMTENQKKNWDKKEFGFQWDDVSTGMKLDMEKSRIRGLGRN